MNTELSPEGPQVTHAYVSGMVNTIKTKHEPAYMNQHCSVLFYIWHRGMKLTKIVKTQKSQRQLMPEVEIYPPAMGPLFKNCRKHDVVRER